MNIIKSIKNLKIYEIIIYLFSLTSIIISFLIFKNENYLTLIASLIGVTALIFVAKGDVLGQILTIVFSLFYGYISFEYKYYGELITYVGMTAVVALISVITWIKHPYDDKEVEVASLNKNKIILLIVLSFIVTTIFYFILKYLNTRNLIISTISVLTSFVAVTLTVFRSRYYAIFYSLNDCVLIVLWILACKDDYSYVAMVICFIMFLVNDIYGFINWSIMKNRQNKNLE